MARLRLGVIESDKPVKLTIELSASVHRDLVTYAEAHGHATGQKLEPEKLIGPMLARFMATDRGFASLRRTKVQSKRVQGSGLIPHESDKSPD